VYYKMRHSRKLVVYILLKSNRYEIHKMAIAAKLNGVQFDNEPVRRKFLDVRGGSSIIGVGKSIPDQVVRMTDLMHEIDTERRFGVPEAWLEENTGIVESRAVSDDCLPSDLAISAAREAIEHAGIDPAQIGLVVFCSIDKDFAEPSTAHVVQQAVGATGVCFDVSSACHGFVHGLHIADAFIQLGQIDYALVVAGETPSKITHLIVDYLKNTNSKDEFIKMIGGVTTGDSGGAAILGPGKGIKRMLMLSEGEHYNLCSYKIENGSIKGQLIMNKLTFQGLKMHRDLWGQRDSRAARNTQWVVTHQTGRALHQRMQKMTGVDANHVVTTYPFLGNLVSSTIPVNLSLLKEREDFSGKQNILLMGSGSGLSVSHTYMEFEV
jgi:3-oxoacyl-(acyl-carrier-protein) synthase III